MRRSVPNWLISSGWLDFWFSKRSAGPPARTVRSTISVISRCGSVSTATRTSSSSRSSSAIHARRSAGGAMSLLVAREAAAGLAARADHVDQLADCDHGADEQPDAEHPEDDRAALGGGVCKEEREHGETLDDRFLARSRSSRPGGCGERRERALGNPPSRRLRPA